MAEKNSQGQVDKAAAENKTAEVGQSDAARANSTAEPTAGAPVEKSLDASENDPKNPYPNYDFMTLESLRSLASERGVEINRDVEKAHLITELRAADSGTPSAVTRRGAR